MIQVVDFPDDETLDEMGAETEFDLLGLFRGRGLPERGAVAETGETAQHDLALPPAAARLLVRRRGSRSRPSSPTCSCTRSATTSASSDADMEAIEREAR